MNDLVIWTDRYYVSSCTCIVDCTLKILITQGSLFTLENRQSLLELLFVVSPFVLEKEKNLLSLRRFLKFVRVNILPLACANIRHYLEIWTLLALQFSFFVNCLTCNIVRMLQHSCCVILFARSLGIFICNLCLTNSNLLFLF